MEVSLSIACAADGPYVPHCAAMLHSLATHHQAHLVRVHFLHDDEMDPTLLERLGQYATELGLDWVPCLVPAAVRLRFPPHHRFGRVAWYRVALPELLPEVDRIVYLDCDLVVADTLEPLAAMDLGGSPLAAVTNPLYPGTDVHFLRLLGVPTVADYFNTGVLVLDLATWRRERVAEAIHACIERGKGIDVWPDQSALNEVLWPRRLALAPRWNAQNTLFDLRPEQLPFTVEESLEARRSPAVVHFIGPYKPWHHRSKHPLRSSYFGHLEHTPWAGRAIEGATLGHRALRLLPAAMGLRVEARLRQAHARVVHRIRR